MSDLKTELSELKDRMESLAERADKLRNKHLRDIIRLGVGRLHDALGHPDMQTANQEDAEREAEEHEAAERNNSSASDPGLTSDAARQARAEGRPFPG